MILQPTDDAIARAVRRLRAGGLVGFPTETVYGLAADARSAPAVAGVFRRKGRPAHNPLIVHVSSIEMARSVCADWPPKAERLAAAFWPGPLTLVLEKAPDIPSAVTAAGPTVAVRVPDHPVALALIEAFGGPLVAPSANPSGRISPTTAGHVASDFPDLLVLDGGPCRGGIESTVVDVTGPPRILRPGVIGPERLAQALGEEVVSGAGAGRGRSPGLGRSHYAPRAPLRLIAPDEGPAPPGVVRLTLGHDAGACAARLYADLRAADAASPAEIWIEAPTAAQLAGPDASLWQAILDRLERAAAGR